MTLPTLSLPQLPDPVAPATVTPPLPGPVTPATVALVLPGPTPPGTVALVLPGPVAPATVAPPTMSDEDCRTRVRRLKRWGLLNLWSKIVARKTDDWPPGKALEYLVLRAFELEGAVVSWPYSVRHAQTDLELEQIDGVVFANGLSAIIEAKSYQDKDKVNIEPIAKLKAQLTRRPPGVIGVVFSRSGFSLQAEQLTELLPPQSVLLWGPENFKSALAKGRMIDGLTAKYRKAIEKALPNYDLEMEGWS